MMENDFPCECGHTKKCHSKSILKKANWNPCDAETGKHGWLTFYCECTNYKASNLKYLEQKYKEKHDEA